MEVQGRTGGGYQQAVKASGRLALWTLAWVGTVALARFGPQHLWDSQAISWAAVAANLVVGIGWMVAHARYLRATDELQRKIMQDALAVTLGVGFVGGFAYVVADAADLVAYDASIALFSMLLSVVYLVAIFIGYLRYR